MKRISMDMEDYIAGEKKKTGLRVRQIREHLAFGTQELAMLIGVTENTILNVEKGEGFNSNTIALLSFYTGLPLHQLFDYEGPLPDREKFKNAFLSLVKQNNLENFERLTRKRKTVRSLLKELATETDYFLTPRKTYEVREYLLQQFDIKTTSPVISQALINASKSGLLKREIHGLRNYTYRI